MQSQSEVLTELPDKRETTQLGPHTTASWSCEGVPDRSLHHTRRRPQVLLRRREICK